LGEGFQLMRTDGKRYDRAGYLKNPASLQTFKLEDFQTTQVGDTLIVTFFATFRGKIEKAQYDVTRLPRLAVFTRVNGDWKVQAFANLGLGSVVIPEADASKAIEAWVAAVASGDAKRIEQILAPEFQITRADGSAYAAADYLKSDLPKFSSAPKIEKLVVTGYGDLMVTRYWLNIEQTRGGKVVHAHAPRLTVFRRSEGTWRVVSHANFAALKQ
jgi:ketosteroid isomerase-like protein